VREFPVRPDTHTQRRLLQLEQANLAPVKERSTHPAVEPCELNDPLACPRARGPAEGPAGAEQGERVRAQLVGTSGADGAAPPSGPHVHESARAGAPHLEQKMAARMDRALARHVRRFCRSGAPLERQILAVLEILAIPPHEPPDARRIPHPREALIRRFEAPAIIHRGDRTANLPPGKGERHASFRASGSTTLHASFRASARRGETRSWAPRITPQIGGPIRHPRRGGSRLGPASVTRSSPCGVPLRLGVRGGIPDAELDVSRWRAI